LLLKSNLYGRVVVLCTKIEFRIEIEFYSTILVIIYSFLES